MRLCLLRCSRTPRLEGDDEQQDGGQGERGQVGGIEGAVHGLRQRAGGVGRQGLGHPQRLVDTFEDRGRKHRSFREHKDRRIDPSQKAAEDGDSVAPPSSNDTSSTEAAMPARSAGAWLMMACEDTAIEAPSPNPKIDRERS